MKPLIKQFSWFKKYKNQVIWNSNRYQVNIQIKISENQGCANYKLLYCRIQMKGIK